jgi:uncharacterized membrane protein YkvA (DUF1232 family)
MPTPLPWLARPALLRALLSRIRLSWRLLRDPVVPAFVKALTLVPLAYVAFPLDVLPDVIPLLGQLDDLGVALAAIEAFIGLCPGPAVEHHRAAVEAGRPFSPLQPPPSSGDGTVIDAEFRRE